MTQKIHIGSPVLFVDAHGVAHHALATAVHTSPDYYGPDSGGPDENGNAWARGVSQPACNLLFVTSDTSKTDPYGRQIERSSSVVHKSMQSARGMFWCFEGELEGSVTIG